MNKWINNYNHNHHGFIADLLKIQKYGAPCATKFGHFLGFSVVHNSPKQLHGHICCRQVLTPCPTIFTPQERKENSYLLFKMPGRPSSVGLYCIFKAFEHNSMPSKSTVETLPFQSWPHSAFHPIFKMDAILAFCWTGKLVVKIKDTVGILLKTHEFNHTDKKCLGWWSEIYMKLALSTKQTSVQYCQRMNQIPQILSVPWNCSCGNCFVTAAVRSEIS